MHDHTYSENLAIFMVLKLFCCSFFLYIVYYCNGKRFKKVFCCMNPFFSIFPFSFPKKFSLGTFLRCSFFLAKSQP